MQMVAISRVHARALSGVNMASYVGFHVAGIPGADYGDAFARAARVSDYPAL